MIYCTNVNINKSLRGFFFFKNMQFKILKKVNLLLLIFYEKNSYCSISNATYRM